MTPGRVIYSLAEHLRRRRFRHLSRSRVWEKTAPTAVDPPAAVQLSLATPRALTITGARIGTFLALGLDCSRRQPFHYGPRGPLPCPAVMSTRGWSRALPTPSSKIPC